MKIFKNLGEKIVFIVTATLSVLLIALLIVTTQVPLIYETLKLAIGSEVFSLVSGDPSKYVRYTSDYDNKEDAVDAADEFTERVAEEGTILLKNSNKALPLNANAKVSIFGKNSVDLVYGGSGSAAHAASDMSTIYDSLSAASFSCNPQLKSFYDNDSLSGSGRPQAPGMGSTPAGISTGETPVDKYTDDLQSSYAEYNDAAIIVISRLGGEGWDIPRTMANKYTEDGVEGKVEGAKSNTDHYLELDANETALIEHVKSKFDNVIVVVNCSQAMELGFIKDDAGIDAALWIGSPGASGINALGRILNGTVNPSGRTVDTFSYDFKKDPTWNNFANNNKESGSRYVYVMDNGKEVPVTSRVTFYEEGIYVGYRYYETRGYTEKQDDSASTWYEDNVVYPFGYGMSYTQFEWTLVEDESDPDNMTLAKDGKVHLKVKITNKGDRAGKDVVQLYYTAPYTEGGIEKAHVVLAAFKKTIELKPEASDVLEFEIDARDMASYDYNNANSSVNNFSGYELERGDYIVRLSRNAHEHVINRTYKVNENYTYDTDSKTNNPVANRFDDADDKLTSVLSRSDWEGTWPTTPTAEDLKIDKTLYDKLYDYSVNDAGEKWEVDEMPVYADEAKSYADTKVKLHDVIGLDYEHEKWDELLDQLTIEEMAGVIGSGCYSTKQILRINKPRTIDTDGPVGFTMFLSMSSTPTVYDTGYYMSGCVLAATYNVDLAYEMGVSIGNESILGNLRGDGTPYSGWYAPAVNIHRSAFGGRNWEYMSEDGLLTGEMAARIVEGAKTKGVYTYVKHFALNEQETNRDTNGLVTWANEQSIREIYLKPFEICVKEADTKGIMSSFNRIGTTWAGGNYALLTEVLRNEWGFEGCVITDFNTPTYTYMNPDQMIRAGGNLNLAQDILPSTDNDSLNATQVSCMRDSMHAILYVIANSNAMNGIGEGVEFRYLMPVWARTLIGFTIGFGVIVIGWTAFIVVRVILKKKSQAAMPDVNNE